MACFGRYGFRRDVDTVGRGNLPESAEIMRIVRDSLAV